MEIFNVIKDFVYKNSITYSILRLDSSLEKDDIVNEVYLKIYHKNHKYLYREIKQTLLNIYIKIKNKQKYMVCCNEDYNIEETIDYNNDEECNIYTNDLLNILKEKDLTLYKYVYCYFIYNMTYREIADKYKVSFKTVKNKVDEGLNVIKLKIKED